MNDNLNDPYVKEPTLTSDHRPWTQRCLVCLKPVNFINDPRGLTWLRVGQYVRHIKCYPKPVR